jgi:hypothetical protein
LTKLLQRRERPGGIVVPWKITSNGGIGDAVAFISHDDVQISKLAVRAILPHLKKPRVVIDTFGIFGRWIVDAVKQSIQREVET